MWHGSWFWPFGLIFWTLVLALIVRFAFWRRAWWGRGDAMPGGAEEALRLRLVKGEIDEAEFERVKGILRR